MPRVAIPTAATTTPWGSPCSKNHSCLQSTWSPVLAPRRSQSIFSSMCCPCRTYAHSRPGGASSLSLELQTSDLATSSEALKPRSYTFRWMFCIATAEYPALPLSRFPEPATEQDSSKSSRRYLPHPDLRASHSFFTGPRCWFGWTGAPP